MNPIKLEIKSELSHDFLVYAAVGMAEDVNSGSKFGTGRNTSTADGVYFNCFGGAGFDCAYAGFGLMYAESLCVAGYAYGQGAVDRICG